MNALTRLVAAIPNPTPTPIPGVSGKVDQLLGMLMWVGIISVIAGFLMIAISVSLENKGMQGAENVKRLQYVSGAAIGIGSVTSIVTFLMGG